MTILEKEDAIHFECPRDCDKFSIETDDGAYDIDQETTFEKHYLEQSNATIYRYDNPIVTFGSETQSITFTAVLSEEQLHSLTSIKVQREDILDGESTITMEVTKLDSLFAITLSDLPQNYYPDLRFLFTSEFPNFKFTRNEMYKENIDITLDLYEAKSQEVYLDIASHITGYCKIGSARRGNISEIANQKQSLRENIYCGTGTDIASEIDSKIKDWNTQTITTTVYPDEYSPISVTTELTDILTTIGIPLAHLTETGVLTVTYPEWAVGASPSIEYENNSRSKYQERTKVDANTYRFERVIPDTEFVIRHGTEVFQYTELKSQALEIAPDESRSLSFPVVLDTKKDFIINTDMEVLIGYNDETATIDEPTQFTVDTRGQTQIWVKKPSGETLFEREFTRSELAGLISVNRSENSVECTTAPYTSVTDTHLHEK
jgi:hypothetical protein